MAITYTLGKNVLDCVHDGSSAIDSTTYFPDGMFLKSIEFYPSGTNDVLVVRDGSATGTIITRIKSVLGGTMVKYFDTLCKPYVKYADCTFGTGANVRVTFEYG